MKTYKNGDLIGLNPRSWLYCDVISHDRGILHARVINGNWDFFLSLETGHATWMTPTGEMTAEGWKIVYDAPFPKGFRIYDYNEAIDYMDSFYTKNWFAQWFWTVGLRTDSFVQKFKTRFFKACKAFKDSWNGVELVDVNDTIPF